MGTMSNHKFQIQKKYRTSKHGQPISVKMFRLLIEIDPSPVEKTLVQQENKLILEMMDMHFLHTYLGTEEMM